ncbi:hypothetical protein AU374_00984 [Cupriavidus metallidurans]|jgi:hypothetical protein|nr:hypothetical protein AU374_00984 [Cupriavidus metallidurans]
MRDASCIERIFNHHPSLYVWLFGVVLLVAARLGAS